MQPYNKLSLIEDCQMSEAEAKDIFLDNIHDSEYLAMREYLSTSLISRTLQELVLELQKKELAVTRKTEKKKRVRRQAIAHAILSEPTPKRIRRVQPTGPTIPLPSVIYQGD